MKHLKIGMTVLAIAALSGCASSATIPAEKLAAPQAAAEAAKEMGAAQIPEAKLHLQLANQQIEQAKELLDSGDKERALRLLNRANADAELAVALTKQRAAQRQALEAINQVAELKQMAR